MGKGGNGQDEGPKISPEEKARFEKASKQLPSYANYLRWAANFRKDEITSHPQHNRVSLLSPMLSGLFSFAINGDTLILGVQSFEAVWMATMPFSKAYVSDRLYLAVDSIACMDARLPSLAIGIFQDSPAKRTAMAKAKYLQIRQVRVVNGEVVAEERGIGQRIPVVDADIVAVLAQEQRDKLKQQDLGRFF